MLYYDKNTMKIQNSIETAWWDRYTWTFDIIYRRVSELTGNEFKNNLIIKHGVKSKSAPPRETTGKHYHRKNTLGVSKSCTYVKYTENLRK